MNREFQIGWRILGFAGAVLALSGCVQVSTRHTPDAVPKQGTAVIVSRLTKLGDALENKSVKYEIIDGFECGNLNSETANTDKRGIATITFRAADNAENCQTVLRITAEGSSRRHAIMVNPKGNLKIDGISAIAVILIASFAIDRIVTGFLFVLSFWPRWAAFVPDPVEAESAVVAAHREKRRSLVYFSLAGILGVLVISWFGGVRILGAMGFYSVHPLLDVILTGLILVAGADRTSGLLKQLGAPGGETSGSAPAPIQITGRLIIDESEGRKRAADTTTQSGGAS